MELSSAREQRIQQRLRGAQRRQVKDVDFGLVFPAISPPAPTEPPAQQVAPEPSEPSPPTPANLVPPPPTTFFAEPVRAAATPVTNDANTSANISAKRRRLDSDSQPQSSVSRSTRSSRQPRRDIYDLDDDGPVSQPPVDTSNVSTQEAEVAGAEDTVTAPPPPLDDDLHVPVLEIETTLITKPDNHNIAEATPADLSASRIEEIQDISSAISTEVETPVPRKRKRGTIAKDIGPPPKRVQATPDGDEIDELSPEQTLRITQKHKASSRQVGNADDEDSPDGPVQGEEAEAIPDEEAALVLNRSRRSRGSNNILSSPQSNDSQQLKKGMQKSLEDGSIHAQQRQPKKPNTKRKQKAQKSSNAVRLRSGSPIPVTVHRLNRGPNYDEDDSDADILNSEIPHRNRGGVNPVDVLNQAFQEVVAFSMDTVEQQGNNQEDPVLRRELKTKWKAVELLGIESHNRLLEHTINVDNSYFLERRLRDEQRKKLGLREKILHIRAEREKVALRMDEIRIRHEEETISTQKRDSLNTAVHDIELALDLCRSTEDDGTAHPSDVELMLKRVVAMASKKGDSGGVLKQIKDFNAFLERAALVLETKRS